MDAEFVTLTPENLAQETLCCIVRTRTKHPGVEAKRAWLAERLPEGHVFCKLRGNGCAFVEYAPLEAAWRWIKSSRRKWAKAAICVVD